MNAFISFPSLRLERLKMCDQNFIENVCTPLETRLHGKLGRYLPREFTEANDIIYIYIYVVDPKAIGYFSRSKVNSPGVHAGVFNSF